MAARHIVLAFSSAKPGCENEFNQWYAQHLTETLTVPGYVRAHRFVAAPGQPLPPAGQYLTVFEIEGDDPIAVYRQSWQAYLEWMTPSDANDIDSAVSWVYSPMAANPDGELFSTA